MILFKPEHVSMIQSGRKTETRRRGKKRWKVGSIHACYTKPPFARGGAEPFAHVRILSVEPTELWKATPEDAFREGYGDVASFVSAYCRINRIDTGDNLAFGEALYEPIWAIRFEVA
jgi:hypothetical protein